MAFWDSSESNSYSTTNQYDKRLAVDNGIGVSGDNSPVNFELTTSSTNTANTQNTYVDAGSLRVAADATAAAIGASNSALDHVAAMANDGLSLADSVTARMVTVTKDADVFGTHIVDTALSTITTNNKDALYYSLLSQENALGSANGANDKALAFASASQVASLKSSENANKDALAFSSSTLNASGQILQDAMTGVMRSQDAVLQSNGTVIKDALFATTQTTQAALNMAASVNRDSLAAVTDTSTKAINAIGTVNSQSLSTVLTSNQNSLALADRSQGLVFQSMGEALSYGAHVTDLAMATNKGVQDSSQNAISQVARAYDTATNYQAEKATVDSRYLVIAGMIVVALAALKSGILK